MLAAAARAQAAGAQVVIASLHCCVEYQHDPTDAQVAAVHTLLASPGHRPRPRPPRARRAAVRADRRRSGSPTASGNFVAEMARQGDPYDEVAARFTFTRGADGRFTRDDGRGDPAAPRRRRRPPCGWCPADPAAFAARGRGARPPGRRRGRAGHRPGLSRDRALGSGGPPADPPGVPVSAPPSPTAVPPIRVPAGTTAMQALKDAGIPLKGPDGAVVVRDVATGDLKDLTWAPDADADVEPVPAASADGRAVIRHSTAHVLAQAVQELFPGTRLGIGPPIENGFYYDFDPERPFTPEDLTALEKKMQRDRPRRAELLPPRDQRRRRAGRARARAVQARADRPQGRRRGDTEGADVEVGGAQLTMYDNLDARTGDRVWTDLCRGPHLPRTSTIPAFSLTRSARRLLAGQREEPAAAAHLRHRVGEQGRAQGLPGAAGRGRAPRPPPARRRAGPVQLPRRDRLRPGRLPPQGRGDQAGDGGLRPPPAHRGGLRLRRHPAHHQGARLRAVRPPAVLRRHHVPADGAGERASTTSRP